MPQLILLGLAAFGGWHVWRAFRREMDRVDREIESVRTPPSETLKKDPETGRYRVKDDE